MIKSFWERHFPWMKDVGSIAVYDKDPTITGKPWDGAEENPKGYNTSATGYELTDGQIHTKSIRPQWCNATVKQRLAIPESAPAKWREKFKNVGTLGGVPCFWEEFSVDLVTMDRPYASYPIDGIYNGEQPSNGPEEGESPQPSEGSALWGHCQNGMGIHAGIAVGRIYFLCRAWRSADAPIHWPARLAAGRKPRLAEHQHHDSDGEPRPANQRDFPFLRRAGTTRD